MGGENALSVDGLTVAFRTARGEVEVLRGVSLTVARGETLAIMGESGSGKSVTARAVLGILQSPPAYITGGKIALDGKDLLATENAGLRALQGDRIAMVFQDALAALNPVFTVGAQIGEIFRIHRGMSRADALRRAVDLLRRVGIPDPERRSRDFPHQFSGGMRQRVMIAMAVALEPDVLLADEPTTALDVTVQAQIMQLLARLRRESGMALVLITHDVAVAAEVADRIAVMYAGRVVEEGSAVQLIEQPAHPYTEALIALATDESGTAQRIRGGPPDLAALPNGCAFHPRCSRSRERCTREDPQLRPVGEGRRSACHFAEDVLAHD